MIKWLKSLFAPTKPGEGMIPISTQDVVKSKEKEWVYVGDGMMEEVIRPKETDMQYLTRRNHEIQAERFKSRSQPKANPGPGAKPFNASSLKSRLDDRRSSSYDAPIYTPYTPSYSGDSYDSGSYSSCDSSSPGGCD